MPMPAALRLVEKPEGLFADRPDTLPTAAVLSIVDGDTIEILWNDHPAHLRYFGVNTPESEDACYREASERNRRLAGGAVRLGFEDRSTDKYGRMLAYVFTQDGRSIDAALVAEGLGKAWKRDGRFRESIVPLEDKAREEKIGCLWKGDAAPRKRRRTRRRAS